MGLFSYYLIEKPCLRLKDRFHKPSRESIKTGKELARQSESSNLASRAGLCQLLHLEQLDLEDQRLVGSNDPPAPRGP